MELVHILAVSAIATAFVVAIAVLIWRNKWRRKVAEARRIADLAISGSVTLDEHDLWLAIDILQTEWERRRLTGNDKPHEDSRRIVKLLDVYEGSSRSDKDPSEHDVG